MAPPQIIKPKVTKRSRKLSGNRVGSKIFKYILGFLFGNMYSHILEWSNILRFEFTLKYYNKNSRVWSPKCLDLFKAVDHINPDKYTIESPNYETDCKQRFKSNIKKLVGSKYIEKIGEEVKDGIKYVTYKLLRIPSNLSSKFNLAPHAIVTGGDLNPDEIIDLSAVGREDILDFHSQQSTSSLDAPMMNVYADVSEGMPSTSAGQMSSNSYVPVINLCTDSREDILDVPSLQSSLNLQSPVINLCTDGSEDILDVPSLQSSLNLQIPVMSTYANSSEDILVSPSSQNDSNFQVPDILYNLFRTFTAPVDNKGLTTLVPGEQLFLFEAKTLVARNEKGELRQVCLPQVQFTPAQTVTIYSEESRNASVAAVPTSAAVEEISDDSYQVSCGGGMAAPPIVPSSDVMQAVIPETVAPNNTLPLIVQADEPNLCDLHLGELEKQFSIDLSDMDLDVGESSSVLPVDSIHPQDDFMFDFEHSYNFNDILTVEKAMKTNKDPFLSEGNNFQVPWQNTTEAGFIKNIQEYADSSLILTPEQEAMLSTFE